MIKYPLSVTIDSNVFDASKYDLATDSTLAILIKYVEKKKIKIFMSNIVVNEIKKHIQNKAYDIAAKVNKLRQEIRKENSDNLIENIGMERFLSKVDRHELAKKATDELEAFLHKLDIEILDSKEVNVEKIFDDYFNINPPFENSEKKRKEFPDAFIAAEIRAKFKKDAKVAIISKDKGFKQACGNLPGYMFFDSLGELYDTLNKEEQDYNKSASCIKNMSTFICTRIKEIIMDNDCVNVIGISYDKDGVQEGYDYDETIIEKVKNVSCTIHTIDEISEKHVSATLLCFADIEVDCYFDDYDNAAWDSESETYLFLETRCMREKHRARFGIRVEVNTTTEEFKISKFIVTLGGDSRLERSEISDEKEIFDSEREILDMDRENIGLTALGQYDSYLEEALSDSKMQEDIVEKFEVINSILSDLEDISMVYDEIMEQIKKSPNEMKGKILKISVMAQEIEGFPITSSTSELDDIDVEDFSLWIEEKYTEISKYTGIQRLPDYIEFGTQINFVNVNDDAYTLSLDEIQLCPSEGEEEFINICLSNASSHEVYKGYAKLTIGYLNFDEDGGARDGVEDDVEFYYEAIIKEMDKIAEGFTELLEMHNKVRHLLDSCF